MAANDGPPVLHYLVYRVGGAQGETLAAQVTAPTFLDSPTQWARQPALAYEYRIVAVNEAGASAPVTTPRAAWA